MKTAKKKNSGTNRFAQVCTDQRGLTRPVDNSSILNAPGGDGSDIGAFEVQAPTAASVSISGKVLTAAGRGLTNVFVVLTDSSGTNRIVQTNPFGYFHFDDVEVGQNYVISVNSKRYTFIPQTITPLEELAELNIIALK